MSDSFCLSFVFRSTKRLPVVPLCINLRPIVFIFLSFSSVTCLFIFVFAWLLKRSVNSLANVEVEGLLGRSKAAASARLNWKLRGKTCCEGILANTYPDIYIGNKLTDELNFSSDDLRVGASSISSLLSEQLFQPNLLKTNFLSTYITSVINLLEITRRKF